MIRYRITLDIDTKFDSLLQSKTGHLPSLNWSWLEHGIHGVTTAVQMSFTIKRQRPWSSFWHLEYPAISAKMI